MANMSHTTSRSDGRNAVAGHCSGIVGASTGRPVTLPHPLRSAWGMPPLLYSPLLRYSNRMLTVRRVNSCTVSVVQYYCTSPCCRTCRYSTVPFCVQYTVRRCAPCPRRVGSIPTRPACAGPGDPSVHGCCSRTYLQYMSRHWGVTPLMFTTPLVAGRSSRAALDCGLPCAPAYHFYDG